jgi:ElaB/YqjD/DUF883 family membrane-anchored ribosome-binding protein
LKKDYKESDKDFSNSEAAVTEIKNLSSKNELMKKMKEYMKEQEKMLEDQALLSGENIESIKQKYNIVEMKYEKNVSYTNLTPAEMDELWKQNQKLITGNFNNEDYKHDDNFKPEVNPEGE